MHLFIKKYYKLIVSYELRSLIWSCKQKKFKKTIKEKILDYYSNVNNLNFEVNSVLNFLKNNKLEVLPYKEIKEYNPAITVYFDKNIGLNYVFFQEKRMYFKKSMNKFDIKQYLKGVLKEQHILSPHRYLTDEFNIEPGSVVADIGVAEGIFALSIIEKASFVYLFEPNIEWVEALRCTFEPWIEKIKIIPKFVSEKVSLNTITLDKYFYDNLLIVDFLKIDVDGGERKLLQGSHDLFRHNSLLKIAICVYHNQNDETEILTILQEHNFNCALSNGFMLYFYDENFNAPFLRRGLIRGTKNTGLIFKNDFISINTY